MSNMVKSSRVGYLGPRGTFTEAALRRLPGAEGTDHVPFDTVAAALDEVRAGGIDSALVPIENSVEGSVSATLDELASGDPLVIVDEIAIGVTFSLVAREGVSLSDIKRIGTHPHAHAQCRAWLAANAPGVAVIPTMSTASAAQILVDGGAPYEAAITAPIAAEHYGLVEIATQIGDNTDAMTRFVLVSRPGVTPPPTGADKTTLVLFMRSNHPGALLEILTEFAVRGVDLTRIESRPTRRALGDYTFSVDCEGHIDEARVGEALMGLHRVCSDVRFLGSYPRHDGREANVRLGTTDSAFAEARDWLMTLRTTNEKR
jgi:prephenate dehydratase